MASFLYPEELPCYQMARVFRKNIAEFCRRLPREEEYRLKDQMLRAARSVTANVAEGFGRHHHQENIQFCRQARGSLVEMMDHLNVAVDEGFATKEAVSVLRGELEKSLESLNGYIAYIKRCGGK
ncbi:MAG: four helix bundle protein [Phycisphaerae bacterium]